MKEYEEKRSYIMLGLCKKRTLAAFEDSLILAIEMPTHISKIFSVMSYYTGSAGNAQGVGYIVQMQNVKKWLRI